MTTTIIDFWKANPSYWIPYSKQKEIDTIISNKFLKYDWMSENIIGQIIYCDQFSRHFERLGYYTEQDVTDYRISATKIVYAHFEILKNFDEVEIIFALMPFKHLKQYDFIFDYLHNHWLPEHYIGLDKTPCLQKFYIDTYKKAFTIDTVRANLITKHTLEPYDASLICDYYPDKYQSQSWNLDLALHNKLLPLLNPARKVIVSLSGGVDSMVMLSLLKYNKVDVSAVHIIYGNRKESEHEYRFLAEFCNRLDVPFFVYRIKWLKRGEVDRQFYEEITRDLRFMTYQASTEGEPCVLMGHIKDDVVENIWTNIAHCHHLGNLKKMETEEVQYGVRIMRPLLSIDKADIYAVSELLGIPYFKNTTPSWSNRGKFREHFHRATITQFGDSIDTKLIEFAEAIQAQNKLLNMLLYEPIYNSFKDNCVNITTAFKAKLDAVAWLGIFEHICHKFLGCARPSIKCVRDFTNRLYRPWNTLNFEMGKGMKVKVDVVKDSEYSMEFICV
jgi:tRNA(Ile)-lysidine synthetase-like protein